jgi:hypothetical protein
MFRSSNCLPLRINEGFETRSHWCMFRQTFFDLFCYHVIYNNLVLFVTNYHVVLWYQYSDNFINHWVATFKVVFFVETYTYRI